MRVLLTPLFYLHHLAYYKLLLIIYKPVIKELHALYRR